MGSLDNVRLNFETFGPLGRRRSPITIVKTHEEKLRYWAGRYIRKQMIRWLLWRMR